MCLTSAAVVRWLSPSWLFATPGTVVHQAPLSTWFPRQEYWGGLPFPSPGDLPNPEIESVLSCLSGRLYHWATWEAPIHTYNHYSSQLNHTLDGFLFEASPIFSIENKFGICNTLSDRISYDVVYNNHSSKNKRTGGWLLKPGKLHRNNALIINSTNTSFTSILYRWTQRNLL